MKLVLVCEPSKGQYHVSKRNARPAPTPANVKHGFLIAMASNLRAMDSMLRAVYRFAAQRNYGTHGLPKEKRSALSLDTRKFGHLPKLRHSSFMKHLGQSRAKSSAALCKIEHENVREKKETRKSIWS